MYILKMIPVICMPVNTVEKHSVVAKLVNTAQNWNIVIFRPVTVCSFSFDFKEFRSREKNLMGTARYTAIFGIN